jgi:hypothetical protein
MNNRRRAEALFIIVTGLALVAHGGNEQLCAVYDARSETYNAVGSCGVGVVKLEQPAGSCGLQLTGDDLGLPRSGNVDADVPLSEGRWRLVERTGEGERFICSPKEPEPGANRLEVECYEGHYTSPRPVCSLTLVPADSCDLDACSRVQCEPGFHPELGEDDCCPVCVADPPPPVSQDPCADVSCAECPNGTVAVTQPGECCRTCRAIDLEACAVGREQYDAWKADFLEPHLACEQDDDCTYASVGDWCRYTCPLAINKYQMGAAFAGLNDEAEELCSTCPLPEISCPEFDPSTAVACVEGRCEFHP